jgi:hypothetical protein
MRYLLLAALALSACSKPDLPPPAVEVRTVTVDRVVTATCVKASDIPDIPGKVSGRLTGDARRDLDIVSASALRLRAVAVTMAAMLRGCAG